MPDPKLEIITDPPGGETDVFLPAAMAMYEAMLEVAKSRGATLPDTRLIASADLLATIAAETERLGLTPDPRPTLERVGGEVGGKSLSNADRTQASVIVPRNVAVVTDGAIQLLGGELVAHELSHLLYSAVQNLEVEEPEPRSMAPWDIAETIANVAAEEDRVSRLGDVVADRILSPTDGDGNRILVADVVGPGYRAGLSDVLDELLPGCLDAIWEYRRTGEQLEEMWQSVVQATIGVAKYIAHTEARSAAGDLVR